MTEDEMVEWHHRLDGHKSEQAPGVGDGQESLACSIHGVTKSWGQLSDEHTVVKSMFSFVRNSIFSCKVPLCILISNAWEFL